MSAPDHAARLLKDLQAGKPEATDELLVLFYDELHAVAERFMRSQRKGHTLQPTALVHEVYLRLGGRRDATWENRAHFLRVATLAMRQALINYAARTNARKRGGGRGREPLTDVTVLVEDFPADFLDLGDALQRLAEVDPGIMRVVDLRFFGDLTLEETARALNVSSSTVKREWRFAKAWLQKELSSP